MAATSCELVVRCFTPFSFGVLHPFRSAFYTLFVRCFTPLVKNARLPLNVKHHRFEQQLQSVLAQRHGLGELLLAIVGSPPKAERCATHPAQRPGLGEPSAKQRTHLSQAETMCRSACATSRLGRDRHIRAANSGDPGATSRLGRDAGAQGPGLGESGAFGRRMRAILAQRPGLGGHCRVQTRKPRQASLLAGVWL